MDKKKKKRVLILLVLLLILAIMIGINKNNFGSKNKQINALLGKIKDDLTTKYININNNMETREQEVETIEDVEEDVIFTDIEGD